MPTYDYRCPNGHDFEKFFRTISASEPTVVCPECGAMGVRQMSAGGGLLFKGSGFYLTDYGKNAHATRGGAKPSGSGEQGQKTGAGGEGGKSSGDTPKKPTDGGSGSPPGASTGNSPTAPSGGGKSTPKKDD
jgi:putative FmdB family regulatory protein